MSIPLEDTLGDIIGKAMRGLGLAASTIAERTGLSPDAVAQLRDGAFDENAARQIAPVLGLNAEALIATGRKSWTPASVALEGLAQFNTAFRRS
jgi:hypothetical protein